MSSDAETLKHEMTELIRSEKRINHLELPGSGRDGTFRIRFLSELPMQAMKILMFLRAEVQRGMHQISADRTTATPRVKCVNVAHTR